MSQKMRAWGFLAGAVLLLGCSKPNDRDPGPAASCSTKSPCANGYKCNFGGANPSDPTALGKCEYQQCGLTVACKKKHKECSLAQETAMCDSQNNDHYCDCIRPNSEPVTPTTGAPTDIPTSGSSGDKP